MSGPRSELVSLLTAARMAPWEDTPRLIVADWLEENGDAADQARAAFVRQQVKRSAKLKFGKRDREPSREEKRLLAAHKDAWLGGLPSLDDGADINWVRGLVDMRVGMEAFVKKPARATLESEAAAWLDEVQFNGVTAARLKKFLALPVAGWVGGLIVGSNNLGGAECRLIAGAERLAGLHTLDMNYNELGDEGAAALADSPHLGNVSHLDLWICQIGPEGARALAGSRTLAPPDWLNLGGNSIGEEGARALAGSPFLSRTRRLLLWGNGIGSAGVVEMMKGPLGPLEELYLNENRLGAPAARAIASWPGLPGLRTLSLWGNTLRARGGVALLSADLSSLRMLLLANNGVGDDTALALADNTRLRGLEQLDLSSNGITDAGVRALLDSPHLVKLKNLNLSGNDISAGLTAELAERFDPSVNDEVP